MTSTQEDHRSIGDLFDIEYEKRVFEREARRPIRRMELKAALDTGKVLVEWRSKAMQEFTVWPCKHYLKNGSNETIAEYVESGEYNFGWIVEIMDEPPPYERPGLKTAEVVARLKELGYNAMLTYGGPIPLDQWTPYGESGGNVRFKIREDHNVTETADPRYPTNGLVLGLWTPTNI